jgi:hypothetical protein
VRNFSDLRRYPRILKGRFPAMNARGKDDPIFVDDDPFRIDANVVTLPLMLNNPAFFLVNVSVAI